MVGWAGVMVGQVWLGLVCMLVKVDVLRSGCEVQVRVRMQHWWQVSPGVQWCMPPAVGQSYQLCTPACAAAWCRGRGGGARGRTWHRPLGCHGWGLQGWYPCGGQQAVEHHGHVS